MKKEDVQFKIDQLRKDKIIYAIEACAVSILCIFVFLFTDAYFLSPLKDCINYFVLTLSIGYTIFMGVGNFLRLRNIIRLEKKL